MRHLATRLFDLVADRFERPSTRRAFATLVAAAFGLSVIGIELARQGWLPARLAPHVPLNHFKAVDLAFYLVLAWEVAALAVALATSVANAAGKQFEVFSLILLRHAFQAFGHLDEPVTWTQGRDVVEEIVEHSGTPYFCFKDIDENKPTGSIKIRVETIGYFLKRYRENLVREKQKRQKDQAELAVIEAANEIDMRYNGEYEYSGRPAELSPIRAQALARVCTAIGISGMTQTLDMALRQDRPVAEGLATGIHVSYRLDAEGRPQSLHR